jgi:phosphonate dehydrogenase
VYKLLSSHGLQVLRHDGETLPPARVRALASQADGMLAFMPDCVDRDFLAAAPRLRVVAGALKGSDNFDLRAMAAAGVVFTRVPDLLSAPTAELAVALAVALARRLPEGDAAVRGGGFSGWRPALFGRGLAGATVGVVGLGAVGRALLNRLAGFAPREVLYLDPDPRAHAAAAAWSAARAALPGTPALAPAPSLAALLAAADIVFPLTPLTPATRHLVGRTALAGVKPGALLVNVGRGGCVDEAAVAEALADGRLAGYAADVFELEDWRLADRPRALHPQLLADSARTLFTPHLGSAVTEVREAIALEAAENIVDVLVRRVRPRGAVDGDAGAQ